MDNTEEINIEKIIHKYGDMVYRIALVHGKTKEDAEDIFQEVFLRLIKYKDRLESEEHIKNWLIRVTINCGKTHKMNWLKHKEGTIKSQLSRGRKLLKRKLGKEPDDGKL